MPCCPPAWLPTCAMMGLPADVMALRCKGAGTDLLNFPAEQYKGLAALIEKLSRVSGVGDRGGRGGRGSFLKATGREGLCG